MSNKVKRKKDKKRSVINKELWVLVGIFIVTFFFKIDDDRIIYEGINFFKIVTYSIIFTLCILFFFVKRNSSFFKDYWMFGAILSSFFLSYVLLMLLLYPINKFNLNYYSIKSDIETYDCKISGISKRRMSRGLYFSFKGDKHFIRGFKPIFNKIENENNMDRYIIRVSVSKGLLNSYIIRNYEILEKLD